MSIWLSLCASKDVSFFCCLLGFETLPLSLTSQTFSKRLLHAEITGIGHNAKVVFYCPHPLLWADFLFPVAGFEDKFICCLIVTLVLLVYNKITV